MGVAYPASLSNISINCLNTSSWMHMTQSSWNIQCNRKIVTHKKTIGMIRNFISFKSWLLQEYFKHH
ncbi:hypothetical protein QQF64_028114 [Cirrhinus molitorella]|uniref:Uncharacterized protein n=1 Tax=Cirrhinus molitorella TaxID=172907 RepID=A0ABR3N5Q7_9TELE